MAPDPAAVFAALPVAVLVIDPERRVRNANSACEQLLLRSERAMSGRPLSDVLTLPAEFGDHAASALFDGEMTTATGQRVRADFAGAELADHPGWQVLTLQPHPVAKRLPGTAQPARAAIGAAAMLAHEVKNPLAAIRGAAQLLGCDGDPGLTGLIITEVDRIAALIDRMQDFTDTRPLALVSANVHPILAHVTRMMRASGGAVVEERFDPSLPPALLAHDALVQVLLNLARNAVAAGAGTLVLASAYRHGLIVTSPERGRVALPIELSVIDDGPGVPPDLIDHLFEPFVSGKPEGRGLGLALANKLVGQMGGTIHHVRAGDRTVFRVLLERGDA